MARETPFTKHLTSLFEKESEGIQKDIEKSREEFSHSGLKGDEFEEAVKKLLQKYLPRKYGLANGQIIDSNGGLSKEVDIGICNEYHPFTYQEGGQGVLFIEGVDCCVEVKSVLNADHLQRAIQNCESVRDLEPKIPEGAQWYQKPGGNSRLQRVPYAIFAFESNYSRAELAKKIAKLNKDMGVSETHTIDLIHVLDTGLIVNSDETPSEWSSDEEYSQIPAKPALLMFLLYLYRLMPAIQFMPNLLDSYFRPDQF